MAMLTGRIGKQSIHIEQCSNRESVSSIEYHQSKQPSDPVYIKPGRLVCSKGRSCAVPSWASELNLDGACVNSAHYLRPCMKNCSKGHSRTSDPTARLRNESQPEVNGHACAPCLICQLVSPPTTYVKFVCMHSGR